MDIFVPCTSDSIHEAGKKFWITNNVEASNMIYKNKVPLLDRRVQSFIRIVLAFKTQY